MRISRGKGAFTLVEMAAVIGIVILLSAVVFAVLSSPGDNGRESACSANLRAINNAIRMYYNDKGFSPTSLTQLKTYGIDGRSLSCPTGHSYEDLFLSRDLFRQGEPQVYDLAYFAGCPWHGNGEKSVVMLLDGTTVTTEAHEAVLDSLSGNVRVMTRDRAAYVPAVAGMRLRAGDLVETGTASSAALTFKDSSRLTLMATTSVKVLQSFADSRLASNCHSVVYVNGAPDGFGTPAVDYRVDYSRSAPGDTYFEISTPALIAGIRGTRLRISRSWVGDDLTTVVTPIETHTYPITVSDRTTTQLVELQTGQNFAVVTYTKPTAETGSSEVSETLRKKINKIRRRFPWFRTNY